MKKDWFEATKGGNLERVQKLITEGADINALDRHGQTALMNATMHGNIEVVRVLLEHGAELNNTAKYNLTALMLAVINQHREIVQLLVHAGADTQLGGSYGQFACTPIEYADRSALHEISDILRSRT
jgi:ankyrin repeat protein